MTYPLRLFFDDGRELTVDVVRRDEVGSGTTTDGDIVRYTRITIQHGEHTGYVLERIATSRTQQERTWQPCGVSPLETHGRAWPHFDQAVMELVEMLEEAIQQ